MVSLNIVLIFVIEVLLTFLCGIFALSADDTLMSKFHQAAYKIRNERSEIVSINKKYVNILEVKTFKFNRTVTAFNVTISSKYDLDDELDVVVQAYKRASNEYRLFPLRMRFNYCKYFKANIFGLLNNALKCGNVTSCGLKKDLVYRICNFVLDVTKWPPLIPKGEYKMLLIGMTEDEEVAVIAGYVEIYYPNKS